MKDCILIQHGSNGHEQCLYASLIAHKRYTSVHDMDYQVTSGDLDLGGRHPMWSKVKLLRDAFFKGYERAIWLDADTLIVDIETDLRAAVPPLQTGMTYQIHDWFSIGIAGAASSAVANHDQLYNHWNTGAVYCGVGDFTHNLLLSWWNTSDIAADGCPHATRDQHALNRAVDSTQPAQVVRIDQKWNSLVPYFESPTPVVKHWAGYGHLPQRASVMQEAREALTWM